MQLIRSWGRSFALFLPHRLLMLLGKTISSVWVAYRTLWPYLLACSAATFAVQLYLPASPDGSPVTVSLGYFALFLTVAFMVSYLLPMLLFAALLPSEQPKTFISCLRKARTHWLALLLPFSSLIVSWPFLGLLALATTLIEKVMGITPEPLVPTLTYTAAGYTLTERQAEFTLNFFSFSFQRVGQTGVLLAAIGMLTTLLYISYLTLFYLAGKPGFGNAMRAIWRTVLFIWRNLPFFAICIAIPTFLFLHANVLQQFVASVQALSPEMRAALAATGPLLWLPLAAALMVQIYRTLTPGEKQS